VRFVADDGIPSAFRHFEFSLHILVARELVQAGDDEVVFEEPVARAGDLQLSNSRRAISSLMKRPAMIVFSRGRIVCQQKVQRLTRQHGAPWSD
jgi:hypothetical protein